MGLRWASGAGSRLALAPALCLCAGSSPPCGWFLLFTERVCKHDDAARFYIHGATPEEDKHASSPARPVHSVVRAVVLGMVHRMMQGVVHAMAWAVDCVDCSADWGADYGVWCRVWCRVWCGVYNAMQCTPWCKAWCFHMEHMQFVGHSPRCLPLDERKEEKRVRRPFVTPVSSWSSCNHIMS